MSETWGHKCASMLHNVKNSIEKSQKKADAYRNRGLTKESRATVDQVLDERTIVMLTKLAQRGYYQTLHGCVSSGKEANVYSGSGNLNEVHVALKVFKTSILTFKDRSQYIEGEFRFRSGYMKCSNPRKMVKQWAEKEFRNLRRIYVSGICAPEPFELRGHVIAMSFIGTNNDAAPRLKDIASSLSVFTLGRIYVELITMTRWLFHKCGLIHSDLSEYNVLIHERHPYIIDVSQSVEKDHPQSFYFLKRDCVNITRFFRKVLRNSCSNSRRNEQSLAYSSQYCKPKKHTADNMAEPASMTVEAGFTRSSFWDLCVAGLEVSLSAEDRVVDEEFVDHVAIISDSESTVLREANGELSPSAATELTYGNLDGRYICIFSAQDLYEFVMAPLREMDSSRSVSDRLWPYATPDVSTVSDSPGTEEKPTAPEEQLCSIHNDSVPGGSTKPCEQLRVSDEQIEETDKGSIPKPPHSPPSFFSAVPRETVISARKKLFGECWQSLDTLKSYHRDMAEAICSTDVEIGFNSDRSESEENMFLKEWTPASLHDIQDLRTIEKEFDNHIIGRGLRFDKFLATSVDQAEGFVADTANVSQEDASPYSVSGSSSRYGGEAKFLDDLHEGFHKSSGSLDRVCDEMHNLSINTMNQEPQVGDHTPDSKGRTQCSGTQQKQVAGNIPEGLGKHEWRKLVKEENREKRKTKTPKHVKKKKKNK